MAQADSDNSTPMPAIEQVPAPIYLPTDVTPEQLFRAIGRLREDARAEIDRLLRFLDETENHMELEPEDEDDDAELEDGDPAEDDGLSEPALGSLDGRSDQTAWAAGSRTDRELDGAESGIGDHDGMMEQIGQPDWQGPRGGMV